MQIELQWMNFSAKYAKTLPSKILKDLKNSLFEQILAV